MTVELRPLGVMCNLKCVYCYQNAERASASLSKDYSLARMLEAADKTGQALTLFGGEPLLIPIDDLEKLFSWSHNKYGYSTIQTNGALINSTHLTLFEKYKVRIGVSIDGPDELNAPRAAGNSVRTLEVTKRIESVISSLCERAMVPTIIVTLHRNNASITHLDRMGEWFKELDFKKIRNVRLHILETDDDVTRKMLSLSCSENVHAFRYFRQLERDLKNIRFDIFRDMKNLLLGQDDHASCVWKGCDPYTTRAVEGIDGNGQRSNCGRMNKEGVSFVKAEYAGYERYVCLYNTPQTVGGCKSCRFFLMCKGQCPGTSIDGDWRNRTEHCDVWKSLFEDIESDLLKSGFAPLSKSDERTQIELMLVEAWRAGHNPLISEVMNTRETVSCLGAKESFVSSAGQEMHEFTRMSWASNQAEHVWSSRLVAIRAAWQEIEWLSVAHGLKRCCISQSSPFDLVGVSRKVFKRDLLVLPLAALKSNDGAFSHVTQPAQKHDHVILRIGIGRAPDLKKFLEATDAHDHAEIGAMLGYPDCCSRFFRKMWVSYGLCDTTWPMSCAPAEPEDGGQLSRSEMIAPASNIFWRPLGIRAVPHLPCSFNCQNSVKLSSDMIALGKEEGLAKEMDWLVEILSWPLHWSALHGVAELFTPILKVCSRTDYSRSRRSIRIEGGAWPAEGAIGGIFPFKQITKRNIGHTV